MRDKRLLILAKMPLVLISLALFLGDFSDGDDSRNKAKINWLLVLHGVVFLDLIINRLKFSRIFYSFLCVCVLVSLVNKMLVSDAPGLFKLVFGVIILVPYLLAAFVTNLSQAYEK